MKGIQEIESQEGDCQNLSVGFKGEIDSYIVAIKVD